MYVDRLELGISISVVKKSEKKYQALYVDADDHDIDAQTHLRTS